MINHPSTSGIGLHLANLSDANPPLLFEMIRSFTTLARTLNLSLAASETNTTRQTVRRHVSHLEQLKDVRLFEVENRQYRLTKDGALLLPEANDVLVRGNAWLAGRSCLIDGLQYLQHKEVNGWCHYQQQKPISNVFSSSSDLLKRVLSAWASSSGLLEHPMFKDVRPYCTVSRKVGDSWFFTEVGDHSSYLTWFGWKAARSSIGAALNEMPGGDGFGHLVNSAYREVEATQSIRLDHVYTLLPHGQEGHLVPICYERLLLGARFPDDSHAIVTVVRRTYDVSIQGVTDEMLRKMPEEMLM